ncbi:MAG: efflux RND transporter periplasmic adaptor subunit, partial [Candidatus Eremiobacterota bacterium]
QADLAEAAATAARRKLEAMSRDVGIARSEKEAARQEVLAARAGLDFVQAEYDRTELLHAEGGASQEELQKGHSDLQQARSRYESTRVRETSTGLMVSQASLRVAAEQAEVARADREVEAAQAALERSQAELNTAQVLLSYTQIRATFAGEVTERVVSPGTLVMPGQVVLRIKQVERLRLQVQVPADAAARIRPGRRVLAHVGDREIETEVSSVFRAADPTSRTMAVEALAPPLPDLVPGAFVSMEISLGRPRRAITLPVASVQLDAEGNPFVWTIQETGEKGAVRYTCVMHPEVVMDRPGKCPKCAMDLVPQQRAGKLTAHRQPVERGQSEGTRVEIVSGLSPGERVIVAGYQNLVEGTPVAEVPWGLEGPLELPTPQGPPAGHEGHGTAAPAVSPTGHDDHGSTPEASPTGHEQHGSAPPGSRHGGSSSPRGPSPEASGPLASATRYTCPMHPEVVSGKPGKCPKCGMKLEASETYTCPMHPEVVSGKPGKCPKCGMNLEKR